MASLINSQMRINKSTKSKLCSLDFVTKGMTYDEIINQLIEKYDSCNCK